MASLQQGVYLHSVQVVREREERRTNYDGTITVHIPISFKRHGGRRYILAPDAVADQFLPPKEYAPILKAIAQAFQWKEMIDRGKVSSASDLAQSIKVNESYMARVLRLSLLAPDIIEAILDGRQPKQLTLTDLFKPIPLDWEEQRIKYGFANAAE
jgi:hypothetical protein